MHVKTQTAGFKITAALFGGALLAFSAIAQAAPAPALHRGADGLYAPFKLVDVPLPDFVRQFSKASGIPVEVAGRFEDELKGKVLLMSRKALSQEVMSELFHEVLYDNGYAAIDLPKGMGWQIQRLRDARDGVLPVYDSTNFPRTYRTITVAHTLRHADGDSVARVLRSFMPANARIIPANQKQVIVTSYGRNISKVLEVIALIDTSEAGKTAVKRPTPQTCPGREHKIEKLVVQKLEIAEVENIGSSRTAFTVNPSLAPTGGRK